MKLRFFFAAGLPVAVMVTAVIVVRSESGERDKCVDFLLSYGWEVSAEEKESVQINIPAVFDEVYKSYNKLQKEAGLDLQPYAGKSGTRYSFTVTNYPIDVGETVYADVICVDGTPVAGDIMTVSLHGFMHSLSVNVPEHKQDI